MSFGPECLRCGHPATYHGASFCALLAGARENHRSCDCPGYLHPNAQPTRCDRTNPGASGDWRCRRDAGHPGGCSPIKETT